MEEKKNHQPRGRGTITSNPRPFKGRNLNQGEKLKKQQHDEAKDCSRQVKTQRLIEEEKTEILARQIRAPIEVAG